MFIQYGGSKNEFSIRDLFKDLLNSYRVADHNEEVIDLIRKVTISVWEQWK